MGRGFVEAMDGDDGEKLFQCPVIDQGLEDAEITKVLAPQLILEFANFLGRRAAILIEGGYFRNEMPVGIFHPCFGGKIQKSKIEAGSSLFFHRETVVKGFATILTGYVDDQFRKLAHEFRILFFRLDKGAGGFFNRPKDFDKEDGVVSHGGAATFTHQCWVGNLFLAANLSYGADNIPSILCQGVVHGTFGVATRPIIVDSQATPNVEVSGLEA